MTKALSAELEKCAEDMKKAAQSGSISLEAQVRAYDLLESLVDFCGGEREHIAAASEVFCTVYAESKDALGKAYDYDALKKQAESELEPLGLKVRDAERQAEMMSQLHDCAKQTYDIWHNSGFFARQRALRILRKKAGFRLESRRIGNYVAKTFDLMNEAMAAYARAQQTLFAADCSYKIKPGIYSEIAGRLNCGLSLENPCK